MTLHNLLLAHRLTLQAVSQSPLTSLALVTAWLDPLLAFGKTHDLGIEGWDEDDEFIQMLEVTRTCFPTIYAGAVRRLRRREPVTDFVREEISKEGMLVGEFEYPFSWGIPLPCYAASWGEPEWLEYHPDVPAVLELFGVRLDLEHSYIDSPRRSDLTALAVIRALEEDKPPGWEGVTNLLRWLWSDSGNSLIDWDEETLYSIQPLSWTLQDVAFARSMIREAEEIYESAQRGLRLLRDCPAAREALQHNIRQIQAQLPEEPDERLIHQHVTGIVDECRGRTRGLNWPDVAGSVERAAAPDPDVLRCGDYPAEAG